MSYDVTLSIDTGAGNSAEVLWRNMTSNVAPMWREAGVNLADLKGRKASDCIAPLAAAIHAMEIDPAKYKAMDPENGWGDYEGCLDFLKTIHEACVSHPSCSVWVSH